MPNNKIAPANEFHTSKDRWNKSERTSSTSASFFVATTTTASPSTPSDATRTDNRHAFISKRKKSDHRKTFGNTETKCKGGKLDKKPFDKKQWRLQKYSKKYKLEQWEDKRKKAVLREYYKEIKDDKPTIDVQKIYEQFSDDSNDDDDDDTTANINKHKYVRNPNYKPDESKPVYRNSTEAQVKPYRKAQKEFERLKQEKVASREEFLKKKAEKEETLKAYKQKKNEKFRRLNKKTKRGQPVMKDRIEMLLEKIQFG